MNETEQSVEGLAIPEEQPQSLEVTQEQKVESDKEINFKRVREELERERLAKEELAIKLQAFENYMKNNPSQVQQIREPEPEPEPQYDPTDWVTYENFDKQVERRAEQILERKLAQKFEEQKKAQAPQRIKAACPDLDEVVTLENCKKLREVNPVMADILYNMQDEEQKTIATYNYIKSMMPRQDQGAIEAEKRLAENEQLPKSPSSVAGMSPLSHASAFEGRLTPQIKQQLYEEALKLSRG